MKKPYQLGMPNTHFIKTPNNTNKAIAAAKSAKKRINLMSDSGYRSDSLNYLSIIKSNIDAAGDIANDDDGIEDLNLQDQYYLE